jgi:hypothetical protein
MNIHDRLQIMANPQIIHKINNLKTLLHQPVAGNPAIKFDQAWEGNLSGYYTLLNDTALLRLYYRASRAIIQTQTYTAYKVCYAYSKDNGATWIKPKLGIYDYEGNKDNNIIWWKHKHHKDTCENFFPFIDTNPDCLPDQKYKAIGGGTTKIYAMVSTDAIHWDWLSKDQKEAKPIIKRPGMKLDSQNTVLWHNTRKQYLLFHRNYRNIAALTGRDIMITTSPDFHAWTDSVWLVYNHPLHCELYTNCIFPYIRNSDSLIGLTLRFHPERTLNVTKYSGLSDVTFMFSNDGHKWYHYNNVWLRPGTNQMRWGTRNNMMAVGSYKKNPQQLCFLSNEGYYNNLCFLREYHLRLDGFVSMHADSTRGDFTTVPLIFNGKYLIINYTTSALGYIKVEFQNELGIPIKDYTMEDCIEIYGDSIKHKVNWKKSGNDVSNLSDTKIIIRFKLFECDLYSFKFSN